MRKVISIDNYGVYKIAFPSLNFAVLDITNLSGECNDEYIDKMVDNFLQDIDRDTYIVIKTEEIDSVLSAVLDTLYVSNYNILIASDTITAEIFNSADLGTYLCKAKAESLKLPELVFTQYKEELLTKLLPISSMDKGDISFFLMSGTDLLNENQLRDRIECLKAYIEKDSSTCLVDSNKSTPGANIKEELKESTCEYIYDETKDLRYKYAYLRLYAYLTDITHLPTEYFSVNMTSLVDYINQIIRLVNAGNKRVYLIQPDLEAFYAAMLVSIVQGVSVAIIDYEKRFTVFPFCNELNYSFTLSRESVQSFGTDFVPTFSTDTYKAREMLKSQLEGLNEDSVLRPVLLKFTLEDLLTYWNTPYSVRPGYSRDSYTINAPVLFGVLEGICEEGVKTTKKLYDKLFKDSQYIYYNDLGIRKLSVDLAKDISDPFCLLLIGGEPAKKVDSILHKASNKKEIWEGLEKVWCEGASLNCTISEKDFAEIMHKLNCGINADTIKKLYPVYLTLNKMVKSTSDFSTAITFEVLIYTSCASIHERLANALENSEKNAGRVIVYKGDAVPLTKTDFIYTNILALLGFDVLIISPKRKGILGEQYDSLTLCNKLTLGKADPEFEYKYKPSLFSRIRAK